MRIPLLHSPSSARRKKNLRTRIPRLVCGCSLVLILHALVDGTPELLSRFVPRCLRELRRSLRPWDAMLLDGQRAETYVLQNNALNIFVISLERAVERNHVTAESLQQQGLHFEKFRAVDGLNPLDNTFVDTYAGHRKRKRLQFTANWSHADLVRLEKKYNSGELKSKTLRSSLHERLRFGCYMSHVLLWQTMLQRELDFIVVLEDDVLLVSDFTSKLRAILMKMPQNWGILYLNGTERKFGGKHDDGVFQATGGVGAFAYALSRSAAQYFLRGTARASNKPIDHVMDEAVLSGKVLAYHASPELVSLVLNMKSTLAYL